MTTTVLREEILSLSAYIEGLPEDLRDGPYGAIYKDRLSMLRDELGTEELLATARSRRAAAMDIRLNGANTAGGRIPAAFLGGVLEEWQNLFWSLAQAAAGRPTSRGFIPAEILASSTLDVLAFGEGSFVTRLVAEPSGQTVSDDENLAVKAIERFERLLAAGASHHELSIVLKQLQGRVLSSYARLLQIVARWESTLTVTVATPFGTTTRRMSVDAARAIEVLPILKSVGAPDESEPFTVIGILGAAHRRTGSFEIDLGEEGTISGKFADSSKIDGLTIGRRYLFTLVEVITTDPLTGIVETSSALQDAQPIGEA